MEYILVRSAIVQDYFVTTELVGIFPTEAEAEAVAKAGDPAWTYFVLAEGGYRREIEHVYI